MSKHGCFDKARHDSKNSYPAQDGWQVSPVGRIPYFVKIETDFKLGCHYDQRETHADCQGCTRKDIQ